MKKKKRNQAVGEGIGLDGWLARCATATLAGVMSVSVTRKYCPIDGLNCGNGLIPVLSIVISMPHEMNCLFHRPVAPDSPRLFQFSKV
jgi:hypothetical protein